MLWVILRAVWVLLKSMNMISFPCCQISVSFLKPTKDLTQGRSYSLMLHAILLLLPMPNHYSE